MHPTRSIKANRFRPINPNWDTLTAMHRALIMPEIQRLAFVVDSDRLASFYSDSKHLLKVALTCRTFLEVALDLMWDTIRGIESLFYVWTACGVLTIEEPWSGGDKQVDVYHWNRAPTLPEWHRLAYYWRRVRDFSTSSPNLHLPLYNLFESFIDHFHTYTSTLSPDDPPAPIFLRLKTLCWHGREPSDSDHQPDSTIVAENQFCMAMVREAPRMANVTCSVYTPLLPVLLEEIRRCSVKLRDLTVLLFASETPEREVSALVRSLANLIRARNLYGVGVPAVLMSFPNLQESIFQNPTVETLWMGAIDARLGDEDDIMLDMGFRGAPEVLGSTAGWPTMNDRPLPQLKSIEGGFLDIRGVIGHAAHTNLRYVCVVVEEEEQKVTWEFVRRFLGAVGSCCPNLESYESSTWVVASDDEAASGTGILMRLQDCTHMSSFELTLYCDPDHPTPIPVDFNPTDDEWRTISNSWTAVTKIMYSNDLGNYATNPPGPLPYEPLATMRALGYIAKNCTKISSLSMPINFQKGVLAQRLSLERPSLESLNVEQSWIDDEAVGETAEFLAGLLSSPAFIWNARSGASGDAWTKVVRLINETSDNGLIVSMGAQ